MIFKALLVLYKHLNVYLFLAQKFLNFFQGLDRAVETFGNFLRIIHQIISPIYIFYSNWGRSKQKCLSNISPKNFKFFLGLHKSFAIFE